MGKFDRYKEKNFKIRSMFGICFVAFLFLVLIYRLYKKFFLKSSKKEIDTTKNKSPNEINKQT